MSETTMPAAEAVGVEEQELSNYELAFHVLPTVAEGEVPAVFEAIKAVITNAGATCTDEEAAERFDLAYEIIKPIEGKNRKFNSAYFGWIRFTVAPDAIADITEAVEGNANVLRHLLIKLTRVEEANPFRFHEALVDDKKVRTVEEAEVKPVVAEEAKAEAPAEEVKEEKKEEKEA